MMRQTSRFKLTSCWNLSFASPSLGDHFNLMPDSSVEVVDKLTVSFI